MIRLPLLTIFCACLLPLAGLAQRTIIVDQAGGGDFTEIQPAVDAASSGDTIRVARGLYDGAIIKKGVKLLGATPRYLPSIRNFERVGIDGVIEISGIPQTEAVLVTDIGSLAEGGEPNFPLLISVSDCAGSVHLGYIANGSISIAKSQLVSVQNSVLGSGRIVDSRVASTDCFWRTADGSRPMTLTRSHLSLTDTSVVDSFRTGSAIVLVDSTLVYSADFTIVGCCGEDPSVTNINSRVIKNDRLTILIDTRFNDQVAIDLENVPESASLVALAFGLSAGPSVLSHGGLHIDPSTLGFLYIGPKPASQKLRKLFPLPAELRPSRHFITAVNGTYPFPSSILIGLPIVFQAAALADGKLITGMPSTLVF